MASSSPLSSVSYSESFYSAHEGDTTTASSPVHGHPCPYREARELPRELKQHCQIFLEEQLYTPAINLLNSILGAGVSRRSTGSSKAVPVPPASHLSLLATLTVHPKHTTRVDKSEHLDASSQALDYLRNLLKIVGPLNADFRTAFQFLSTSRGNRRSGAHSHGNNSEASDDDSNPDEDRLRGPLANQGGLWHRSQNFWSVLGWAMNCSSLYPNRWRYWKVWVEFMLEVLEADWHERERRDMEAHEAEGSKDDVPTTSREGSMIAMYMAQQNGREGSYKEIIKALLADGSSITTSTFRQIFDNEPRGRKKESKKRKRQTLDLDNDQFGDYFDDDSVSSGASEPPTPQKSHAKSKEAPFGTTNPGMVESIYLRLRLFKLISLAVSELQKPEQIEDLYEQFSTGVQLLPLPIFSLIITQRSNPLLPETHVTVLKELFEHLLPGSHKKADRVDPEGEAAGCLTATMMEKCFALHPANTVAVPENAKLSLAVESAIQLLWTRDALPYSEDLATAVEKGIIARDAKVKKERAGKGKTDPIKVEALQVLSNSADRLRLLMDVIKSTAELAE